VECGGPDRIGLERVRSGVQKQAADGLVSGGGGDEEWSGGGVSAELDRGASGNERRGIRLIAVKAC